MTNTRCSAEEVVRRGREWYDREMRQNVEPDRIGQYVMVDVETGEYEVGPDYHVLSHRMQDKKPGSLLCALRIGHATAGRIEGRFSLETGVGLARTPGAEPPGYR